MAYMRNDYIIKSTDTIFSIFQYISSEMFIKKCNFIHSGASLQFILSFYIKITFLVGNILVSKFLNDRQTDKVNNLKSSLLLYKYMNIDFLVV